MTKRAKITKSLDKLCRLLILKRDGNTCQKCGKYVEGANAHTSHVIPKSHGNSLRWDLLNLKLLCFHDHINWWHKNPTESGEWFKTTFPDRSYYLHVKKNEIKKWSLSELSELEKEYKNKLRD